MLLGAPAYVRLNCSTPRMSLLMSQGMDVFPIASYIRRLSQEWAILFLEGGRGRWHRKSGGKIVHN